MQVTLSVRRGSISSPNTEKIQSKVEKLTRFYDRIASAEVVVDLEDRNNPALTLLLKVEPKKELVVQSQAGELFASLDEALKKMEQQLKKFKEKLTDPRVD
ncbi:MAG: ribosome-associated translation inhibitor RaiA [Thermoguttaceae bacterium]|nr:ribosome-associated translation inhibitor RaiA [Thermoguttaceae bacterium]MDO4859297.1 ribosome-associated translation inhibitor RaiA [Thermoguttaceae bacterium]